MRDKTLSERIKGIGRIVVVGTALALAPAIAQAQTIAPRISTLASALACTNEATLTINTSTNLLHGFAGTHRVQLCAILAPTGANSPTNGNFCTNCVLTFDYLMGTNLTTDNEFVWTINSPALSQTAQTNPIVVKTNLTLEQIDSVTGLQLKTALGHSTNALGFKLTVQVHQTP